MSNINFSLKPVGRACNGCTKCCDGWLTGQAYGLHFYPGKACQFKGSTGCMIYLNRPKNPCVSFECEWKRNGSIPEDIKPNKSNIIIVQRSVDGIEYWGVSEAGKVDHERVSQWLATYHQDTGRNIVMWSTPSSKIFSKDLAFVEKIKNKFPNSSFTQ